MHFEESIGMDISSPSVGDLFALSSRTELIKFDLSQYLLSENAPPRTPRSSFSVFHDDSGVLGDFQKNPSSIRGLNQLNSERDGPPPIRIG
jgi:hypothetical protein